MYKLVALDLDDTLLNDEGRISDDNKSAIKRASEAGIKVIIVSGRDYASTKQFIFELNLPHLTASLNGAYILDPSTDQIVYSYPIDFEMGYEILKDIEEYGVHTNFYDGTRILCQKETEYAKYYKSLNNIEFQYIDSLKEYSKKNQTGKLLLIDEREKLDKIRKLLAEKYDNHLNILYSKPIFLEIFDKQTSKGAAVLKVAKIYGVKPEEIMAIGDGENDVSMIKSAGLGIAVGNASDRIKEKADFSTLSNNESGVAYAIKRFIFGES